MTSPFKCVRCDKPLSLGTGVTYVFARQLVCPECFVEVKRNGRKFKTKEISAA